MSMSLLLGSRGCAADTARFPLKNRVRETQGACQIGQRSRKVWWMA